MAAAVPRLDLGQDGDQAYSPSSAPFSLRPAARTPAGRSLLLSTNPLFDQGADSTIGKPGIHEGEQTPRLGASGKLSDLKSAPGPVSSARKWLAGQARSPAGAALAGSAASPALASASPLQLPAAAAAQLAADAPTPRLLSSAGKLTPRTDTGVAPSPATQFPRSFPVAVGAKPQVTVEPSRGLASWLRMSSHLSKPTEAAAEPHSPAGSDVSGTSSGSDGTRPRTVASLDFTVAEVKAGGGVDSTTAAPAAPAAEPAAAPAAPATSAVAVTGKTSPSAAAGQPVQTDAKRRAAAVRSERSSLLSLPAVQLLLLCLLGGLLLAAPLAMHAFNPTLTQRYLQGRMPDLTAYILQLRTTTSRHVSELSAAAAHSATRLKVAASHHGATAARGAARLKVAASHHGSQLQAAVLQQAQLARATVQQAQQTVTQAFHRHVAAAKKAFPATTSPSKLTAKAAAVTAQQQALRQAQPSKARAAVSAAVQAAVPKAQPAAPKPASQAAPKATIVPDVVKAPIKAPANVPVTQPKRAPARASSPVPPAVKPQAQSASKNTKPQAATKSAPQASAAKFKPEPTAMMQPAVRAKPAAQPQQAAAVIALHSQAAAFAAARLAPVWQQLRARLPFLAPPAAPAVAEAAAPLREVQPSALAVAAAAAVAGLAALVALGSRAAASYDAAAEQEEAALDQEPAALPAFPTTTPAVGGRASRTRRQSEAVIAEAEDEGLPSVVAPRQRRASALPAATPGTAPRTSRRKSAASVDVPPSPTSATTTRRRSMRLAA